MPAQDSYALIWATIKKIPKGRVATYGQVAREAGFPKQPRLAGYALHHMPAGTQMPWHRVINAQGKISFPVGSEQYEKQKRLLEEEGVLFLKGRVDLTRYQWRRNSDAPILD